MVTPETGTIIFRGMSGRDYAYNIYSSDVIGAYVTFSAFGAAGATSQNFLVLPERCVLKDLSVITGQTVCTSWLPLVNDTPSGVAVLVANSINTLAYRSIPNVGFEAGRKFTLVQA